MSATKELWEAQQEAEWAAEAAAAEAGMTDGERFEERERERERHDRERRRVAEREARERKWAADHPAEWAGWVELLPVLDGFADPEYAFLTFLAEVGPRREGSEVGRRDKTSAFAPGNLVWVGGRAPATEGRVRPFGAKEAAALLGVGVTKTYELFKAGLIGGHTVDGRRVFDRDGVLRYKEAVTRRPRESPPPPPARKKVKPSAPPAGGFLYLRRTTPR